MKQKNDFRGEPSPLKKYYGVMIVGLLLFLGIMTYYSVQFKNKRELAKQQLDLDKQTVDVNNDQASRSDTTQTASSETPAVSTDVKKTDSTEKEDQSKETLNQDTVSYNGKTKMGWPVTGNVILPYSVDTTVYFESLDQYRINPGILIEAKEGTPVKALKEAAVEDVRKSEEFGKTVTLDLGNGYTAFYGQLKNITVKQGDVVKAGQIIGQAAAPTDFYTLEGTNIYLQMEKNKKTVNPVDYLE